MTFSAAPLRVAGVTIRPRWAWSAGYRAHVRAQLAPSSWQIGGSGDDSYLRWLEARGVDDPCAYVRATQPVPDGW